MSQTTMQCSISLKSVSHLNTFGSNKESNFKCELLPQKRPIWQNNYLTGDLASKDETYGLNK